jgi:predicted RNA-binding Zn ribbon-like protein
MADRIAQALANTALGRDRLDTPADLAAWLTDRDHEIGIVTPEMALRLSDFRALRAAIRSAFQALVIGGAVPGDAVRALNDASAAVPSWPVLDAADARRPVCRSEIGSSSAAGRVLAAIARSAIELLGGPDGSRLRACDGCDRFFLAARPSQVWCSAACGNRARVARHRARSVGTGASAPA